MIPIVKVSELKRILRKHGCRLARNGSRHDIYYSPITGRKFPISRHDDEEVKAGTLDSILKKSGIKGPSGL